MAGLRVLVCGGRTFEERRVVFRTLSEIHAERPIALVITGGAPGADRLGQAWADSNCIPVCTFPPNWSRGKKAGPIRTLAASEYVQARGRFWRG